MDAVIQSNGGAECDSAVRSMKCSADERDQRLMLAEEILSDLATGYWVAVMDDHDDPVEERMGQRILNYWRKWESPPNEKLTDESGRE